MHVTHETAEELYYFVSTGGQDEGHLARVGVTDYAQSKLGDVVYVELPEVGKRVE
jgi:glycine cleavage system H lipoate-binding protein